MGRQWYPRYTGDFMRNTGHLSLTEVGAYNRLLDHYYSTEKPLPGDPVAVRRIAGAQTSEEIKAVELVLAAFFYLNDGNYHNRRADRELLKSDDLSEKARQAAEKRWAGPHNPPPKHHGEKPKTAVKEKVVYPNEHVKAIFDCEIFNGVKVESVAIIVHNNMENPRFKTNLEEFLGDAANVIVSGAELPRDWNPPTKKLRSYLSSSGPMSGAKGKEKRTVQFE